jgi:hypothetical protein
MLQLLAPHYIFVCLLTYVYKPRLAYMLRKFKADAALKVNSAHQLALHGVHQTGALCKANVAKLEKALDKFYAPFQTGGFVDPD